MISREDPRPAYRQVADAIRADIESGRLVPGEAIPSIAELGREHGISSVTVQRAVTHLKSLGLVETRHGSGTFVRKQRPWTAISSEWWRVPGDGESDHWTTATREHGFVGNQELLRVETAEMPEHIRDAMEAEEATAVVRERLLRLDGEPMQICGSWFPHDVADGTRLAEPRKIKGGTPKILGELDDPPTEILKETVARMPTQTERELLDLPAGVPVLDVLMVAVTAAGRPVEVGTLVARGDRHRMRDRHPA